MPSTGDAYGVIARYIASLVGLRPAMSTAGAAPACLAFSVVSLPGQFFPVAVAVKGKSREAREVQRATRRARAVSRRP